MRITELSDSFKTKRITGKVLEKLFYYSLFDSSSFEVEDEFFPIEEIVNYSENLRKILKRIFEKESFSYYFKDPKSFQKFEKKIIATDILSKILLIKKLGQIGVEVDFYPSPEFDLKFKKGYSCELKRICLWTNYSEYWGNFLEKVKKGKKEDKYIYLVACTHPFIIEKIVPEKENRILFDKYLSKMIRSHYLAESFIMNKNIIFVIKYIRSEGGEKFSLSQLCEEIKDKIKKNDP